MGRTKPTPREALERGLSSMSAVLDGSKPPPEFIPPNNKRPRTLPPKIQRSKTEPTDGPWKVEQLGDGRARVVAALHPGQAAGMESTARTTAIISGTQSGKTTLGPLWLEREIRLMGPGDYLAVTATYPLLQRKMLPEFLRLFETTLNLGHWAAGVRTFVYHDGRTRVLFGSATSPESLESATAKAAWLDEAGQAQFRLESVEAIDRRLSLYQGRKFISTTPYNTGWLKTHIFDRAAAGDRDTRVIQFPSTMNPSFPLEEMERVRATLPAWKVRMMYEGRFDKPPGLIYSDYEDSYREQGGHLVRPRPIPDWWPRYLGIDFGGVNLARVLLAQDPLANVFYVIDEQLVGNMTAAQHARQIVQMLARAPLFRAWGGAPSEENWRMEFSAAGIMVEEPPIRDVEVGIDRTIGLFKTKRLFVFDTCLGLRAELGSYSREVGPDGDPTDKIRDKALFHRCVVAGTLVETSAGQKPIERIRPGELVLTRRGYRRVVAAGLTERAARTITVELSNGTRLTGTPEHPVWVCGRGWVAMDALRYGMLVECNPFVRHPVRTNAKSSSSKGSRSGAIQRRRTTSPVRTFLFTAANRAASCRAICTSLCGKTPRAASSQRAGSFTTWTTIHSITTSRIFSRCLVPNIIGIINTGGARRRSWLTSRLCVKQPRGGMPRKLAWPGTLSTAGVAGLPVNASRAPVSSVGQLLRRSPDATTIASVATRASRRGDARPEWTTRLASVLSAGPVLWRTDTSPPPLAAGAVEDATLRVIGLHDLGERMDVFNLTVEDVHEYFANGVLVSNCDALRYVCLGVGGPSDPAPVLSMRGSRGWTPRTPALPSGA